MEPNKFGSLFTIKQLGVTMSKIIFSLILMVLMLTSCKSNKTVTNRENILDFEILESVKFDDFLSSKIFITGENNYISSNLYDKQLVMFNSDGRVIKKAGGAGEGPGEFRHLTSTSISNGKILISDYEQYRISIFNEKLDFIGSFISQYNYINEIVSIPDKIILLGKCAKDLYNQQDDFFAGCIYEKLDGEYKYIKNIFPIKEFPELDSNKFLDALMLTANVYENGIDLLLCYSPNLIRYNTQTGIEEIIPIDFPGYINPIDINIKNYKKKGIKRWGLQHFPQFIFCYAPTFLWYDNVNRRYVTQFHRPYQLYKESENKNRYINVIFDSNFEYESCWYSDNMMMNCESKVNTLIYWDRYLPFAYSGDFEIPDATVLTKARVYYD